MTNIPRTYTDPKTGLSWPLFEADTDYTGIVYKSDRRKSVIADPSECLIAKGLKHDKDVAHAFIGAGKDAFVVFRGKGRKPAYALHYVILAKAAKVRDTFDAKGAPPTQYIKLSAPTAGRTLEAREKMNKRRRAEIKAGAPVKHRQANRPRVLRLDGEERKHRPKPIVNKGEWTVPEAATA